MDKTQALEALQTFVFRVAENSPENPRPNVSEALKALGRLTRPLETDKATAIATIRALIRNITLYDNETPTQIKASDAQDALDRLTETPETDAAPMDTYKAELHENVRDCILDGVCQSIMETVKGHIDRRMLMVTARERVYNECFCLHEHTTFANPPFMQAYNSLIHEIYTMTADLGNPD